jgi:hypothetical protein
MYVQQSGVPLVFALSALEMMRPDWNIRSAHVKPDGKMATWRLAHARRRFSVDLPGSLR